MNLNFLGRHGVKLALAATIVGSLAFASCEKETLDVNGPGSGQTIVVPGTDLTGTNALVQQILTLIKEQQYNQLQALLEAMNGNNTALKDELKKVVDQLKENDANNTTKFNELSEKLTDVIEAINALNDKLVGKLDAAIAAINDKDNGSAATIAALERAVEALKTASAENAQNIINGLKSDYTDLLKELKEAIANAHDEALQAKLEEVLTAINNKKDFSKDDLKDVTDKLAEILDAVKDNKAAVESLKELITNNTTKVSDIEALLKQMVTSTPEALQNIITEINKNNNANTEKIETALAAIKNADKDAYEQIINAMNAFKLTVEGKLDKANEALEALKKQNEEAYKILVNILQQLNNVTKTEATVADANGLSFVDKSEIAPTSSVTAEVVNGAAFNWDATTGEYFAAATIEIPNAGAIKVLADDKAALLKAVNEDNIQTKTYNAASKKFTRGVGDVDWIQAKLLLTNKINELPLNWDATTPRMFTVKGNSKDAIKEATLKFTEKYDVKSIAVYCVVNGTVYYVIGKQCEATDQGNIEPKFELKTESGDISHDFTHDYDHDHGHGHGNGNAGGGIGGK